MQILNIDKNLFTAQHPTKEGTYLWLGEFTGGLQLITVYREPAKQEYGMSWDSYLAVVGMRGRSVELLQGKFLKVEVK